MPKIVFLSDTHGFHSRLEDLPAGDVIVHAGDCTMRGKLEELEGFTKWFEALPYKHKILVAGNHDWCFQTSEPQAKELCKNITYLCDSGITACGLNFYGSPWQPRFQNWAFNKERGAELEVVWAKVPENCDVLITHTPPEGILDMTHRGVRVGCEALRARIEQLHLKLHLFGHIHECQGALDRFNEKLKDTVFVNGSICDQRLRVTYKPLQIILEEGRVVDIKGLDPA